MAAQTNEPRTTATASRRASPVDDLDGGFHSKHGEQDRRARRRACPITALFGLLFHLIISSSGAAINVLIVHFNLEVLSAGTLDLVSRILLFVASCMSIFYVLMHGFAAREHYVRSHGSPQIFGYFTVAVAVLIMRLAVPVWTASVVLTALVAAKKGFNAAEGLKGNTVWLQLGLASLGLISIIVMVVITETTDRPFATSWFSRRSFIKGEKTSNGRVDTFDLSVSRAGNRKDGKDSSNTKAKGTTDVRVKDLGFDRSTINTPESPSFNPTSNPALATPPRENPKTLVRVRSQPFPTPLEAVFTSESVPFDAQESPRKLAWRPPRGSKSHPQRPQIATVSAETPLTSNPPGIEVGVSPRLSSRYSNVEVNVASQLPSNTPASPKSDSMTPDSPVSPAFGSVIDNRASAPLRIANPDEVPAQQEEEAPTLAKILGQLSTRAAARRRNSLLVRQAELTARPAIDKTRAGSGIDMAAALFDQPTEYVQPTPERIPRRASMLVRQADLAVRTSVEMNRAGEMSVFSLDASTEFTEIPVPPPMTQRTSFQARPALLRSNTAGPMLVRNFSRPGGQRPRTAGGEEECYDEENGLVVVRTANTRSRGRSREEQTLARRSRSLPPNREQSRSTTAGIEKQSKRNTSASGRRKGSPPSIVPRFSPFPKAPVLVPAGAPKVKGLGQGSVRRLDKRIEQWRDGVLVQDDGRADGDS